jgi:hypothetical protein
MRIKAHNKKKPAQKGAAGSLFNFWRWYSRSCAGVQGIGPLGGGKGQVINDSTVNRQMGISSIF